MANIKIFFKALKSIGFVMILQLFILVYFFLVKMLILIFFKVDWVTGQTAIATLLTILTTVGVASYFYESNKKNQEIKYCKKQESLLASLYAELSAISNKEREIEILDKKISTIGNLEWTMDLFQMGLTPAHGIWKLNTEIYVTGLDEKIKGKQTRRLKNALIHISQKIELIENYILEYNKIPGMAIGIDRGPLKEIIMGIIEETIELVRITKDFMEKEFGVK